MDFFQLKKNNTHVEVSQTCPDTLGFSKFQCFIALDIEMNLLHKKSLSFTTHL